MNKRRFLQLLGLTPLAGAAFTYAPTIAKTSVKSDWDMIVEFDGISYFGVMRDTYLFKDEQFVGIFCIRRVFDRIHGTISHRHIFVFNDRKGFFRRRNVKAAMMDDRFLKLKYE